EALQSTDVAYALVTAQAQDRLCAFTTNARNAQQLVPVSLVDFYRGVTQVQLGPAELRVDLQRQIALRGEGHVTEVKTIIAQQDRGLVQAVLAPRIFWRVLFHWRVWHRAEGGKVHALQAQPPGKIGRGGENFAVAFARAANDELRHQRRPAPVQR